MSHKDLARRARLAHSGARTARASEPAPPRTTEYEIKLEVPHDTWPALESELSGPDTDGIALQAIYHDTDTRDLARAHIAVRMRREGDQWVQTLKAPGAHALERLEDNVPLGPALPDVEPPTVDLARHRSQAALALRQALGLAAGEALPAVQPVFEVRVQRRLRRVVEGRSTIEVALDSGELLAAGRSRPIRELELELKQGDARDLLALAQRWRQRWGLWINTASKAARGNWLAAGDLYGPAEGASRLKLPATPKAGEFTAAVLAGCLAQVLANASQVASGSQGERHIHQLRVGLRRLRTALRELPGLDADLARTEPALVAVFRGLGQRRDRTHVLHSIQPLVEAAGGLPLRVPAGFHDGPDPGELVRSSAFQDALLALLLRAETIRGTDGESVRRMLRERLRKLHKQVAADSDRFVRLPVERQHRVRKRLKRLRYLGEFAAPLFAHDDVEHYLARLKPAQDALGQFNDEAMAQRLYEELVGSDAGAAFGAQWLRERRRGEAKACRAALRKLALAPRFWAKSRGR